MTVWTSPCLNPVLYVLFFKRIWFQYIPPKKNHKPNFESLFYDSLNATFPSAA